MLRTCSLPDLSGADEPQKDPHPIQVEDLRKQSVAAILNDTNFDEDEERNIRSISDPEEEDMDDLCANLSHILNSSESGKYVF